MTIHRAIKARRTVTHKAVQAARRRAVEATKRLGLYHTLRRLRHAGQIHTAGVVEEFSRELVAGWIVVRSGAPPVRVTLSLNGFHVGAAWADAPAHRHGSGDMRSFSLRIKDVWQYARRGHKLVVKADGRPLPITGHGMFLRASADGPHTPSELKEKFADGYVLASNGKIQLSRKLDVAWQRRVFALYDRVSQIMDDSFGYQVFGIYGTLLGAVREGNFIGHDFDLDIGYLSRHRHGPDAAEELKQISLGLIDRGYSVELFRTVAHIHHPETSGTRIDLFHTYFDMNGTLQFPFGAAGTRKVDRSEWNGVVTVPFADRSIAVPTCAEAVVEGLYGAQWRRPNPGFVWRIHRRTQARDGMVERQAGQEVYWTNFYAHTQYTEGSTFFNFINDRPDTPRRIIDLGCGDGRDSVAFGAAHREVLGLDRSHIAVQHGTAKAASMGLSSRVSFEVCDAANAAALDDVLDRAISSSPDPVMFYMRFFLHSIPADVQDELMNVLAARARSGDMIAAEFRTTGDETKDKVHQNHYRRFQDGPTFGVSLSTQYGFDVLFEHEGSGLSPYRGEDPVLYRVVGRRR